MIIGIDVSKAALDVALHPSAETWQVENDSIGIAVLVEHVQACTPELIVLEATGGYEHAVVVALGAAGLPVAVVNPRQVRDFAKAMGLLALSSAARLQSIRPAPCKRFSSS